MVNTLRKFQVMRRYRYLFIGIIFLLVLMSCQRKQEQAVQPLFKKHPPAETHITFRNNLTEERLMNSVNYLYFYDGGGVAVGDINNDSLPDIFFTANQLPNRLYLNKGNFQFEDITERAGVGGTTGGWTTGATMADVNGDGLLDIYVCQSNYLDKHGPNQLYINNGDLTFSEKAAEYGVAFVGLSRQAAFFDYDRDGDLDLYLLNHSVHSKRTYGDIKKIRKKLDEEVGDKLFRNDGKKFVNVTAEAGILESVLGYGLGVAIGDINWDGYPDIYISNDFHEDDYLYYNNGDGTFTEAMRKSMRHVSLASMGNDMADFNNDGLLDVVVLDMLPEDEAVRKSSISSDPYDVYQVKQHFGYYHQLRRNTLQLNRGPALHNPPGVKSRIHLFSEIGQLAGIHATDWSWTPLFVDLDNDGFKDLFISNGIYRRPNDLDYLRYVNKNRSRMEMRGPASVVSPTPVEMEQLKDYLSRMPSVPQPNYAFQSRGDLTFVNRANEWGLGDPGFSSGAAYADFDNDGDMDLVTNNLNAPAAIYENLLYQTDHPPLHPAHYLKIRLNGTGKNVFGIGAKVILHYRDKLFYQEMMTTRGFQSAVEPVLNFGLGEIGRLDSLEVIWQTGEYQVLKDLPVDRTLILKQSEAPQKYVYKSLLPSETFFKDVTAQVPLPYSHQENKFIEYNREPFIPHFLSTEGPAFAVGDVNGDGLADLYLGGAKFRAGGIFLQTPSGAFQAGENSPFADDSRSEDVDAAFFDANGDGHLDLYVVSGGNEFWGKAEPLLDRLYLNDGGGNFRRSTESLPKLFANGACVKPADYDGDGDIDLFVGSRSVVKHYGEIPESFLLVNDGRGNFTDQTAAVAPELSRVGMVTDAVWADLDNDGDLDLAVVGEWMPITVFRNDHGRLKNVTNKYHLQNTAGWWNCVTAADLNGDGYIDLIAGNLGLNSILKASSKEPIRLYINDFSGNGKPDQILTYESNGNVYPFATAELILTNIPTLQSKFHSFSEFAGKTIEEIFTEEQLKHATVRTATEFASLALLNTGNQAFHIRQLPAEAQFSPVYSILIEDVNADRHPDILLGGNFYSVPPDQGRYDASYGSVLLGDGTGNFQPLPLQKSGFVLSGEIRQFHSLQTAAGEELILAARNNDTVLIFRKTKP